jgi:hypothetical protein
MAALQDKLQSELNTYRKAQDKFGTLLLSTILADVKNKRIELQRDLTDDDVVDVLRRGIKRRKESVEMYEKGAREDLASRERAEFTALEKYLPASVSDDELRAAIKAAVAGGAKNIGSVMGKVMPQFKGRADGSVINRIAREELGPQP